MFFRGRAFRNLLMADHDYEGCDIWGVLGGESK